MLTDYIKSPHTLLTKRSLSGILIVYLIVSGFDLYSANGSNEDGRGTYLTLPCGILVYLIYLWP
jgi:hypothetical protein